MYAVHLPVEKVREIERSAVFDVGRGCRWPRERLGEIAGQVKQRECDDRDGERYQKRDEQSFCEVGEQAHISVAGAMTPRGRRLFPAVEVIARDFVPI